MFEIEDKPVDENAQRGKYPFCDMAAGQSFTIPAEIAAKVSNAAVSYGKTHGMKFSTRRQVDGTYRCGRVA